jgi:hypothetical protein
VDVTRTGRLPFWGAVLLFSSALTCTAAKPVATTTGSGGAPPANAYGTSACGTCVAAQCSAAVAACGQDPECASFLACLDACPVGANGDADATCAAACPAPSGTAGQEAVASFQGCRGGVAAACAACGAAPADGGGIALLNETCPPSQKTDPCARCDDEKCCAADDACNASPECAAILACLPTTPTYGDVAGCVAMHPAGALVFTQRFACRLILCTATAACGGPGTLGECDACFIPACPDTFAELVGTPDGFDLYYTCRGGPCAMITTDVQQYLDCLAMCRKMYPAAALAFDDWYLCATTRCPTHC